MNNSPHETIRIQPDIQVRFITYEDSSHLVTNHWHNSMEILLIRTGLMNVWVNDNLRLLKKGDFIIINSRDIHATKCIQASVIQLLQIPYAFLKTGIPDIDYIRFLPDAVSDSQRKASITSQIADLLYEMGEVYNAHVPGYALKFSSLLYQLLYLMVKNCISEISPASKVKNDINRKRLILIIEYIEQHYTKPVSLAEAAAVVSLNPQYFCRFFKKNMGTTFHDYVNEVRMTYIYYDIMNTNHSITQILETHGFTNYKLFMKMFREKFGCTPVKKRKQTLSDPAKKLNPILSGTQPGSIY